MRYLVLTDVHANLEALNVCLADAAGRKYDRTLILGDLVGYGADPNAVVASIQGLHPIAIVRGNHDKVACGLELAEGFNAVARAAVEWTLEVLTPMHRAWLAALPQGPTMVDEAIEICHGSPFDEDHYIFDTDDASIYLGICWFAWAVLWALFFALLALDRPIARIAGAVAIIEGIGTAWVFGMLLLLDQIAF